MDGLINAPDRAEVRVGWQVVESSPTSLACKAATRTFDVRFLKARTQSPPCILTALDLACHDALRRSLARSLGEVGVRLKMGRLI